MEYIELMKIKIKLNLQLNSVLLFEVRTLNRFCNVNLGVYEHLNNFCIAIHASHMQSSQSKIFFCIQVNSLFLRR